VKDCEAVSLLPGLTVLRVKGPHQFVAWLAMLAMLLIVVMPTTTQLMPMAHAMPGMDASCPHHLVADSEHRRSPHAPADPMEWCGYCFLLHHAPLLGTGEVVYVVAAAPAANDPVSAVVLGSPYLLRLSADPRGPPAQVG
jgi:hypothetical protein